MRPNSVRACLGGVDQSSAEFGEEPLELRVLHPAAGGFSELEPSVILPGHGGAVKDMDEFRRFVEALPAD
jgi:hypothetical protein